MSQDTFIFSDPKLHQSQFYKLVQTQIQALEIPQGGRKVTLPNQPKENPALKHDDPSLGVGTGVGARGQQKQTKRRAGPNKNKQNDRWDQHKQTK